MSSASSKTPSVSPQGTAVEPTPPHRTYASVPWSPWAAVVFAVVVYFAAQLAASLLVVIYPHLRGWSQSRGQDWLNDSVIAQFWFVLFAEALTFGAIWWFIRRRHSSLRAIGWRRFMAWDVVRALSGFAVYFVGFTVLLGIVKHFVPSLNLDQKQDLGFSHVNGDPNLILTFLSLVVMPPVVEETVFRGFVFTGIRGKLKPVWAALLTSLLFATAHLQFGSGKPLLWVAGIDTFTLSLVLCYLRHKSDSLWPGILLHAFKNAVAFATLYLIQ